MRTPTIGNRTTGSLMKILTGGTDAADRESFYLSMILFGKPVPTFPDHAVYRIT